MASERQYFVTEEGLAALEKELEELKTVGRRKVAEKIKVALSFGDLSENSEYDEAKNDQAMMEARIADLEVMLQGAVVIDVGMNRNELGKLCGDVNFDEVKEKASFITPVPGGVGPMTITELLENTILAAQRHHS